MHKLAYLDKKTYRSEPIEIPCNPNTLTYTARQWTDMKSTPDYVPE